MAKEVAAALNAELDVVVARKIGAPDHPEWGVGAVTAGGDPIYDRRALRALNLTEPELAPVCERERAEAERRTALYRGGRPLTIAGRDVVLVDDGLATGVTARAALRWIDGHGPRSTTLAVPVAARASLGGTPVVAVLLPKDFRAVSRWYDDFAQTTDDEVLSALE